MKFRKYILYGLFLVALFLPLVQKYHHFLIEPPLAGAYVANGKPVLTLKDWLNGSFQARYEAFENDTLGFHHTAVRLRNSFCLKFFHKANAAGVVVGKNNFLFEKSYLDAYVGFDYIGRTAIEKRVCRIRQFQDSLDKEGKKLIIYLAPSKADYFSEYLPNYYRHIDYNPDSTNYQQFRKLFKQYGVRFIDYNQYFMEQKSRTEYPLYPQYGIHWSQYGAIYAMDSLIRYAEQLLNTRLNGLKIDGLIKRTAAQNFDYDLATTMNLAGEKQLKGYPLYYPQWRWEEDTTLSKPNLLTIADSYYWSMYNEGLQYKCFSGQFWYYNKTVYPESLEKNLSVNEIDVEKAICKADIVMIMCTTPALSDVGWGLFGK